MKQFSFLSLMLLTLSSSAFSRNLCKCAYQYSTYDPNRSVAMLRWHERSGQYVEVNNFWIPKQEKQSMNLCLTEKETEPACFSDESECK